MRCRKCGASIPTDSKFCNYCGAKINRLPTRDGSMPARPRDENFDDISTVRTEKIEEPENRGQRALVIFFIVLASVIFAGVSVLVYQYMKSHQRAIIGPVGETEEEATATVSPTKKDDGEPSDPTGESTESVTEAPSEDRSEGAFFELNGFSYKVENGALTLVRCNTSGAIVALPSEIDGLPLKVIGNRAFYGCSHLQYLDIPEGVTTISDYALAYCPNLREVVLPDSIVNFAYDGGVFDYTGGFTIICNPNTLGYRLAEGVGIPWKHGDSISVISE